MRRWIVTAVLLFIAITACTKSHAENSARSGARPLVAGEPDYRAWNSILSRYYDPARGMDYAGLEKNDSDTLHQLRQRLGRVAVSSLTPQQQLAYWINLYNVNVVSTVVEHDPVKSIRDISTDPIIRLNVFKKDPVPFGGGHISLHTIEHEKIRSGFHDSRIHFAINCAARSRPPIRRRPTSGRASMRSSMIKCGSLWPDLPYASTQTKATRSCTPRRSWSGSATTSRSGPAAESPSCAATFHQ